MTSHQADLFHQTHGKEQTSCFLFTYKFHHHCREAIRQGLYYIVEQKCKRLGKNGRQPKPNFII